MTTTLDSIEKTWARVTPGPWTRTGNRVLASAVPAHFVCANAADAQAIAQAPDHIAWLVERVKELEAAGNALAEDAEYQQKHHPEHCFSGDRLRAWGALVDP